MTIEHLTIARPDDCEEVAKYLEELAAEARSGAFIGFSGVLVRPGGAWAKRAYLPHSKTVGVPEMIGYLFTAMCDLAEESKIAAGGDSK